MKNKFGFLLSLLFSILHILFYVYIDYDMHACIKDDIITKNCESCKKKMLFIKNDCPDITCNTTVNCYDCKRNIISGDTVINMCNNKNKKKCQKK